MSWSPPFQEVRRFFLDKYSLLYQYSMKKREKKSDFFIFIAKMLRVNTVETFATQD